MDLIVLSESEEIQDEVLLPSNNGQSDSAMETEMSGNRIIQRLFKIISQVAYKHNIHTYTCFSPGLWTGIAVFPTPSRTRIYYPFQIIIHTLPKSTGGWDKTVIPNPVSETTLKYLSINHIVYYSIIPRGYQNLQAP